jgi:hypothetical protein
MNENIQQLFSLLDSNQQKVLVKVLAENYDKKPLSIRNNWFSGYKQIPNKYQGEVLRILQRRIELFNLTPQS